jgi:hypothetical protein
MTTVAHPATAAEIVAICGHLDDDFLAAIAATGATAAEVLEAFTWYSSDDQIGTELQHGQRGNVRAVYEILMQDEPDPDDLR